MNPRRLAVPLLALFLLTGCAPAAPAAAPSSAPPVVEPSVTPEPEPVVDTLLFRAESIQVLAGGAVVDELSALDVDATVAGLTAVLGDAVYEEFPAAECTLAGERWVWLDSIRVQSPTTGVGVFSLRFFEPSVTGVEGQDVALVAQGDVQVGDDISALIAATDPALVETYQSSDIVLLEAGWFDSGYNAGVAAFADGGVVQNIGLPIAVNSNIDC
jgi:hypothetical protein